VGVTLDSGQREIVDVKRKKAENRPSYFNSGAQKSVRISDDFEAFLILQGRQRNQETINWLNLALDLTIRDGDRDALAGQAIEADVADAEQAEKELRPLINFFTRFKTTYQLTGFEQVTEAGLLLADMQRPMSEIIGIVNRLKHRKQFGALVLADLKSNGVSQDREKQIRSWFSPLTAY